MRKDRAHNLSSSARNSLVLLFISPMQKIIRDKLADNLSSMTRNTSLGAAKRGADLFTRELYCNLIVVHLILKQKVTWIMRTGFP